MDSPPVSRFMVDCKRLLLEVLESRPRLRNTSYDGLTMRYGLVSSLLRDFAFIEKNGADAFYTAYPKKDTEGILEMKRVYDTIFQRRGYITFDEQITLAVDLLNGFPDVRETVQGAFDYVMVDEVQDLDESQAELVGLLVRAPENNLMICGDADQSIYSFRGGSNRFMLEFTERYPGAKDYWLEDNYRSSEEIVRMANHLIEKNEKRVPVKPRATYRTGFAAIHIPCFKEARLPELIKEIREKGYAYEDIAVIARTNKTLLRLCETADTLAQRGGTAVPLERPKFYLREDYVFCSVLDLLCLSLKGMGQDEALFRLLSGINWMPGAAVKVMWA